MPRRIEMAPLLTARSLTVYGLFSSICMGMMIYKALHEQENALMASSWINNSNGCLAVSNMYTDTDRGKLYNCRASYFWSNYPMYHFGHSSSNRGGCVYPVLINSRLLWIPFCLLCSSGSLISSDSCLLSI